MTAQVIELRTVKTAIRYGDEWQAHAMRMEALLALVTAQRDASELLLSIAEDELLKYRGLNEPFI